MLYSVSQHSYFSSILLNHKRGQTLLQKNGYERAEKMAQLVEHLLLWQRLRMQFSAPHGGSTQPL